MAQAFDTLSAAHELEASGFKREQAEAIAAVVRAGQGELATKFDLRELRGEVKQDIAQLEVRLAWRLVAAMGVIIAANAGMLALFKFIG